MYEANAQFVQNAVGCADAQSGLFVVDAPAGSAVYVPPNMVVWEKTGEAAATVGVRVCFVTSLAKDTAKVTREIFGQDWASVPDHAPAAAIAKTLSDM